MRAYLYMLSHCHCNYASVDHFKIYVKTIRRSHHAMYRFEFYVSFCWNLHIHFHGFECHVPKSTVFLHMPNLKVFTVFFLKWFDKFFYVLPHDVVTSFHFTWVHICGIFHLVIFQASKIHTIVHMIFLFVEYT